MMKMKFGREKYLLLGAVNRIVFISCVFFASSTYAETNEQNDALAEYKKLLAEQQNEFQIQRQIIVEQGKELEQLKVRLDSLTNKSAEKKPLPDKPAPSIPKVVAENNNNNQPPASPNKLPSKPVGQAPESIEKPRPPEMARLDNTVGGVLTKKGTLVVEPSMLYSYTSNNRVYLNAYTFLPGIAVGLIDVRQIKQHSLIGSLGGRYGLTDRLEVEFRVPYTYRTQSQIGRPLDLSGTSTDQAFNSNGTGIGDLELYARYQLSKGTGGWPILVGNMAMTMPTGKSPFDIKYIQDTGIAGFSYAAEMPTGVGYYSIQPSLTALYPTDPAVFFGSLSYSYNTETDINANGVQGKFNPGNAIGLSFGMGFGINERSSFSLGYSHKHVLDSQLNGATITGSTLDIGQLLLGYSFKYSQKTTYNLSLAIGTTADAPDASLNLRVPMSFDLF